MTSNDRSYYRSWLLDACLSLFICHLLDLPRHWLRVIWFVLALTFALMSLRGEYLMLPLLAAEPMTTAAVLKRVDDAHAAYPFAPNISALRLALYKGLKK